MKRGSGATASVWMGTADVPSRPALAKDITADVCIVGAGIAGLTTAYLLADEDRSVVVLDDGPIAGGETRGPAQVQPEKQRSITGCPLAGGGQRFVGFYKKRVPSRAKYSAFQLRIHFSSVQG